MSNWHPVLKLCLAPFILLTGCSQHLSMEQSHGYHLPERALRDPVSPAFTDKNWQHHITQNGLRYTGSDFSTHGKTATLLGASAWRLSDNQMLWQSPLSEPLLTNRYNNQDTALVTQSAVLLNEDRLLNTYLYSVPEQHDERGLLLSAKQQYWAYDLYQASSGKLLKHHRETQAHPTLAYHRAGPYWLVIDWKNFRTTAYNTTTAQAQWTHADALRPSTLTDQYASFYRNTLGDRWRVTVLDLATGAVSFDWVFENLTDHIISGVRADAGLVYIDFGAQYGYNVSQGERYYRYTIAYDMATRSALWRTPLVKS